MSRPNRADRILVLVLAATALTFCVLAGPVEARPYSLVYWLTSGVAGAVVATILLWMIFTWW